jgi:hypothetical protein
MDAARARTRHQVEARCFDQVQPFPKGTQQPVDSSGVLAFIAGGDVSPKKRGRRQQARKRTDFVWRGEDSPKNCRIPLRSSLSGAPRMEKPRLPRNLSASSRLYAKSTDCVVEVSGFELSVPICKTHRRQLSGDVCNLATKKRSRCGCMATGTGISGALAD